MKITKKVLLMTLFIIPSLVSCNENNGFKDVHKKDLELHLTFDEGKGNVLHDLTKKHKDVNISYVLSESETLKEKQEPMWRKNGAVDGALLFDGYSSWASYNSTDISIKGKKVTISAWVAPRAYSYDSQTAISNDEEVLTGIVSQFYKDEEYAMGAILGYHRDGNFSFQVGTGNNWFEIWNIDQRLKKYEWNYITATFNGEEGFMSLYLNGKIINIKEIDKGSEIKSADVPLLIGTNNYARSSGSCSMDVVSGMLDDIKIYNTALNNKDIKEYFEANLIDGKPREIAFSDIWLQDTLSDDVYKTQFHGGPYQHWMNEPHAPIYYKGIYHLFFQFNIMGPYFNNANGIAWGHLVSSDMVNWVPLKEAIVPTLGSVAPDGIWSGGSTYSVVKGVKDVPTLLFTAGDHIHQGALSNQNIGVATPVDPNDPYLVDWEISDKLAVKQMEGQGQIGEFRDAHVWIEDDTYYLAVGSRVPNSNRGCVLLYTSSKQIADPMHNWTYRGMLYDWVGQDPIRQYGSTWELPVMLPLTDALGNKTGKYILIISPAPAETADNNIVYWIGTFDKQNYRFVPDYNGAPKRMDYGRNVFTGPSGFIDPNTNMVTIFSIMQDQRESSELASSGWSHCVGLPRQVYLEDNELKIRPVPNIYNLGKEDSKIVIDQVTNVDSVNEIIKDCKSNLYNLKVNFTNLSSDAKIGIKLRMSENKEEFTTLSYSNEVKLIECSNLANANNSLLSGGISNGYFDTEELEINIFVDNSLIEAFFNNTKTISVRSYPKDYYANYFEIFVEKGNADIKYLEFVEFSAIDRSL